MGQLPLGVLSGDRLTRERLIEETDMARSGSQERTKGASQQAQGRLKEAIGALTGDRRQVRQGHADQGRGRLRERWGHVKDALRR
jgi:uncharacterized protein YjbJ (UPF0337 family)